MRVLYRLKFRSPYDGETIGSTPIPIPSIGDHFLTQEGYQLVAGVYHAVIEEVIDGELTTLYSTQIELGPHLPT